MNSSVENASRTPGRSPWQVFLIWCLLYGWSLCRIPIPGVNEPHYLTKARHWWNPEWCRGDFFLDSANPHQVFYLTFGWLTQVFSLETSALIGRGIGLLILACGWQRMIHAITGRKWAPFFAVPIFLLFQTLGNFSGEWLVGGIEAKVPSYGFLFWSIGSFLCGKYLPAALLAGLSVSLHPLVGLWGVIAAVMASGLNLVVNQRRHSEVPPSGDCLPHPDRKTIVLMGVLLLAASLPGLIPAVSMLKTESAETERIANQLQVGDRLSHHLDPMKFPRESYRYWGMMIVIWQLLESTLPLNPRQRWWRRFVIATVLIALLGIVVGFGPRPLTLMPGHEWRIKLLKFYFFRLGDLMVFVAVSISAIRFALRTLEQAEQKLTARGACAFIWVAAALGAFLIRFPDANPSRMKRAQLANWVAACNWIDKNSQETDQCYVTDSGWAMRWYTGRPEFVNFKDMPQDAVSIVEWNRRLWVMADWRVAAAADQQITPEELAELRKQTGIRFLVSHRFVPFTTEPVYRNDSFRIDDLSLPGSSVPR